MNKEIAIVEGTDYENLSRGAGHMIETAMPGEGEQIIISGHRDTVFKEFVQIELGDIFLLKMPYGEYKYEIRDTKNR
ncbi:sortase [Peptoniphilus sp. KCTC 25270]|nr:sortase [Peptoniphilus sp. KCTC 25270]